MSFKKITLSVATCAAAASPAPRAKLHVHLTRNRLQNSNKGSNSHDLDCSQYSPHGCSYSEREKEFEHTSPEAITAFLKRWRARLVGVSFCGNSGGILPNSAGFAGGSDRGVEVRVGTKKRQHEQSGKDEEKKPGRTSSKSSCSVSA